MSNYSEIGHAKNVANFEDLINRCVGFGVSYNPSLNAIKIVNMNTLRTNALNALASAVAAGTAYTNAVDNRQLIFDPLQKMGTRIISALKACGASDAVVKDALSINRKIQGKRAKPIKEVENVEIQAIPNPNDPPVEIPKNVSVSQLSFDSMIEHYSKLIDLLASVVLYNPNENDLKVVGLNALLTSMKTSNTAVITATTNYINARINRDNFVYAKNTGVVEVAQDAKDYVKSVFGTASAQYKQVSSIKFTRKKS